ncbi:MAG: hypothetical protein GDA53_00295 [Rhodobacteraceae bacterium]|nr:hypothetical protein [Paracoccaceae bacterium]
MTGVVQAPCLDSAVPTQAARLERTQVRTIVGHHEELMIVLANIASCTLCMSAEAGRKTVLPNLFFILFDSLAKSCGSENQNL